MKKFEVKIKESTTNGIQKDHELKITSEKNLTTNTLLNDFNYQI